MNWRKKTVSNCKLYCILDKNVLKGRSPQMMTKKLYRSGVDIIQLRYKNFPSYKLVGIAEVLARLAKKYRKTLIINDRVDVALASGAKGVHLGAGDFAVETARFLLGRKSIIGRTVHSVREAKLANKMKFNYIGAGPVFSTPLKKNLKKRGTGFVRKIKKISRLPVFAIGGINIKNAKDVLKAGVDGVCVARGIFDIAQ